MLHIQEFTDRCPAAYNTHEQAGSYKGCYHRQQQLVKGHKAEQLQGVHICQAVYQQVVHRPFKD